VVTGRNGKQGKGSAYFKDIRGCEFSESNRFCHQRGKNDGTLKQEEGEPRPVQLLFLELATEWCWSLLEELQTVSEFSKLPVVALVNGNEELLDRAYEMGVKTYLRMPFTFPEFLERSRLLNLRYVILRSADQ